MLNVLLRLAALVALVLAPMAAQAVTAEALVQGMGQAFRGLNYRGYLSYEYGANIESFAVVHAVIDGQEYEKISAQAGAPAEIIRTGHALNCLHSGNQLLRYGLHSPASMHLSSVNAANDNVHTAYQFVLHGTNRVAGRDVYEVHVSPRDALRNGYKFSIDQATGLMLKSVVVSPEAKVLERFQFIHIAFDTPVNVAEFDSVNAVPVRQVAHGSARVSKQVLSVNNGVMAAPSWLPAGFVLAEEDHHHDAASLMLYSDGLATVSIVMEKATATSAAISTDGRARRGSMVAYTRPVVVDGEKYLLTVMGEVPLFTAARIARHMQFQRAS